MKIRLTAKNSINSVSLLIRDYEFNPEIETKYFHVGLASEMQSNPELTDWKISGKPVTPIFNNNDGNLSFSEDGKLAFKKDLMESDRCVGSVWEALSSGEILLLNDGCFILDEELDLSPLFV